MILTTQKLFNISKNKFISNHVVEAKSFRQRAKGLLGQAGLDGNECLWIHSCSSIHTFFMKFAIDVLYVDLNLKVTRIDREVDPWGVSWGGFKSKSCFEFQAKNLDFEIELGDSLRVSS